MRALEQTIERRRHAWTFGRSGRQQYAALESAKVRGKIVEVPKHTGFRQPKLGDVRRQMVEVVQPPDAERSENHDQQKENQSDRELTAKVRQALVKDKSLSTYAHNVKIIAQDGIVTLKGPVRSEEEKKAVEEKAAEDE